MDSPRKKVVIIMGPPGSGKGVLCQNLRDDLSFVHLSTGDFFREAVLRNTEMGRIAENFIRQGQFVPDEVVTGVVDELLKDTSKTILLDGFPRTFKQALSLASRNLDIRVILLQIRDNVCLSRVLNRRTDPLTNTIYNLHTMPPPTTAISDRLVRREYDIDEDIVNARLRTYYAHLGSILPCFKGKIQVVNADQSPQDVAAEFWLRIAEPLQSLVADLSPAFSASLLPPAPPSVPGTLPRGPGLCTVCLEAPSDHLVVPCGHQCGCETCLTEIIATTKKCPICRLTIQGNPIKVFLCGVDDDIMEPTFPSVPEPSKESAALVLPRSLSTLSSGWGDDAPIVDEEEFNAKTGNCVSTLDISMNIAPTENISRVVAAGAIAIHDAEGILHTLTASTASDSLTLVRNVAVTINVPDFPTRNPVDICCVVDVSGSMSNLAQYEDESGAMRDDGLSVLDVVKHAVKTVIAMMGEDDRLAIVAFENSARTEFTLSEMTTGGRAQVRRALTIYLRTKTKAAAARLLVANRNIDAVPYFDMSSPPLDQAVASLDDLVAGGGTNLWGGLLAGMDTLRTAAPGPQVRRAQVDTGVAARARKASLLLLTDGQPSVEPPRGHSPELKLYLENHPDFRFQLNTFGFGYSLKSELLHGLAAMAGGTFCFIPDSKIVGTCFVNTVANAITCVAHSATVHLLLGDGASFAGPVYGSYPVLDTDWGRVVTIGPLQAGQSRDIVVPLNIPVHPSCAEDVDDVTPQPYLEAVLHVDDDATHRINAAGSSRTASLPAVVAQARSEVVDECSIAILEACKKRGNAANQRILALLGKLRSHEARLSELLISSATSTPTGASATALTTNEEEEEVAGSDLASGEEGLNRLSALIQDVEGRIQKALSTSQRWDRWGVHYLRALTRAHQLQQRTNFMDPGLQVYGGELFEQLVEKGGQIFISLPAPVASSRTPQRLSTPAVINTSSSARNYSRAPAAASMSTYYAGSGGGCFSGSSTVMVLQQREALHRSPVSTRHEGEQSVLCTPTSFHAPENTSNLTDKDYRRSRGSSVPLTFHSTPIKNLRSGDRVLVAGGKAATVICVVEQFYHGSLLEFNTGLQITPTHPVRLRGAWRRPIDLHRSKSSLLHFLTREEPQENDQTQSYRVYNVLLDTCHVLLVNDVECVTWAHGLTDPEIAHPFYGTSRIVDVLACMAGWSQGYITAENSCGLQKERQKNISTT